MKKYLVIATALLLSGCATKSSTPPLSLSLTSVTNLPALAQGKTVQLQSQDSRDGSYIAVIDSGTANVSTIEADQNIATTLQQALNQQLTRQGFQINHNAASTIGINVEKALVQVDQDLVKYSLNSQLQLELVVNTPKGKFVKHYSGKATKTDVLKASQQDIAASMENLMNSVLNNIAHDGELNKYLTENI